MGKLKIDTITKKLVVPIVALGISMLLIFVFLIYPLIYSYLRENTVDNIKQLSNQTMDYINYSMDQYELYSGFINNDENLYQLLDNHAANKSEQNEELVNDALSGYMNHFSGITAMNLVIDGEVFNNIGSVFDFDGVKQSDWYSKYMSNGYSRYYSPLVDMAGMESEEGWMIVLAYPYRNKGIDGDLFLVIPFYSFAEPLRTYQENQLDFMVLGRENNPFYIHKGENEQSSIQLELLTDDMEQNNFQHQLIVDHNDGFYIVSYSELGGWKLVIDITNQYIIGQFAYIRNLIFFIILVFIILFVAIVLTIVSQRLKPLRHFTKQMDKIGNGSMDVYIDIQTGDEVEKLGHTFNRMIERIKDYTAQQIKRERREKKMEYALVLAQVDPHFIYKTLNIITFLAMKKDTDRLIEVNHALVNILKDRLRIHKIDIYDSIEQELEMIQSYIVIQRVRYGDHIQFESNLPKEIRQEQIPKNIIQPLIENAIFHGLLMKLDVNGKVTGGTVTLSVNKNDNILSIKVKDDGIGMDHQKIQEYFIEEPTGQPDRGKHIGIRNIRQRLNYLYGKEYSIQAKSEKGVGTEILLKLKVVSHDK